MKKASWLKANWLRVLVWAGAALLISFCLINVFWVIYAFAKYGGQPIDQIPAWALWYMFRH